MDEPDEIGKLVAELRRDLDELRNERARRNAREAARETRLESRLIAISEMIEDSKLR